MLDRNGGAATFDGLDAPSEAASLDGDDALFDGLDDIVDVRGPRPEGHEVSVNRVDNESALRRPRCSY